MYPYYSNIKVRGHIHVIVGIVLYISGHKIINDFFKFQSNLMLTRYTELILFCTRIKKTYSHEIDIQDTLSKLTHKC